MMTRRLASIAAAIVSSATSPAALAEPLDSKFPADSILGEWCTQKEENRPPARVNFVRAKDGSFMGILSWSSEPRKDVHNRDPNLRDRSVVGIVLMWNLHFDDGEYVDGYVYNPEDGGTYRVKLELASPESLKVRGYLGISLLGQTKVWARFHP